MEAGCAWNAALISTLNHWKRIINSNLVDQIRGVSLRCSLVQNQDTSSPVQKCETAAAAPSGTAVFWPVITHLYLTPLVTHKSSNGLPVVVSPREIMVHNNNNNNKSVLNMSNERWMVVFCWVTLSLLTRTHAAALLLQLWQAFNSKSSTFWSQADQKVLDFELKVAKMQLCDCPKWCWWRKSKRF